MRGVGGDGESKEWEGVSHGGESEHMDADGRETRLKAKPQLRAPTRCEMEAQGPTMCMH